MVCVLRDSTSVTDEGGRECYNVSNPFVCSLFVVVVVMIVMSFLEMRKDQRQQAVLLADRDDLLTRLDPVLL